MNKSKQKGTTAETKVVRFLAAEDICAKRKALSGSMDEGDIQVITPKGISLTLEVKAGKQTDKYNRSQLEEWMRQTIIEGEHCKQDSYLVIVRHGRSIKDAEVFHASENELGFMYLNTFASKLKEL